MRKCVQCGAEFETKRDVHFFCSDDCRKAARGSDYRKARALALLRDGYACTECSSEDNLECHHKHPLCYGGDHSLGNLQTLCRPCHKAKHRSWKNNEYAWITQEPRPRRSEVHNYAA
jgi:5-methylcytosine-specific restriction endonuclease McrA